MNADQEFIENSREELEDILQHEGDEEAEQNVLSDSLQEGRVSSNASEKKEKRAKTFSSEFSTFKMQFEQKNDPEEKIRCAIDFMKGTLSHAGAPRFRDFWEARKECLPLFKENISPKSRALFWQEYVDLSVEARRLKEILDEQSVFAFEQIDLAIQALVKDLEAYDALLNQLPDVVFPDSPTIQAKKDSYNQAQKELHLLNALASKINALRKEVIKTEMRIRNKNKLFEKLSSCGDKVFPRRKELIKMISQQFLDDVERFVGKNFASEQAIHGPLHVVREEIKALQSIAKLLTLNTHAFTETRLKLSECWDKIKGWEKERKKEINQKKQEQKQNFDVAMEKVKSFEQFCKEQTLLEVVEKQYEEVLQLLREMDLGRFEMKTLREEMNKSKQPFEDKQRRLQQEAQEKERAIEGQRLKQFQDLKMGLQSLLQQTSELNLEELIQKKNQFEEAYQKFATNKAEKMVIDRLFKQLKDLIHEKKSQNMLKLSQTDQDQLHELKSLWEESKERRQEIKNQLEVYRKALGGSGFDFEKAMMYRELIEAEKISLERMNQAIDELEEKITEIEG